MSSPVDNKHSQRISVLKSSDKRDNLKLKHKSDATDDIFQAMRDAVQDTLGEYNMYDGKQNDGITRVQQQQDVDKKLMRRKLVKLLRLKIEKIKEKQIKKRQQKQFQKQSKANCKPKDNADVLPQKEVLIRLKPFTQHSKDYIHKEKGQNSLLQFKVIIGGNQSKQKTRSIKDIISFICKKWKLRRRDVELRLCKSAADIVQQESINLLKFDQNSDTKLSDILTSMNNNSSTNDVNTIYLLYDIKKKENQDGYESSESSESSSSSSNSSENVEEDDEDDKQEEDDEDKDLYDIFKDLLNLMALNKNQRIAPPRVRQELLNDDEHDNKYKDSQMIPLKIQQRQNVQPKIENAEPEQPMFAQGLEYYSQLKLLNKQPIKESSVKDNSQLSFSRSFLTNKNPPSELSKQQSSINKIGKDLTQVQSLIQSNHNSRKSAFLPIKKEQVDQSQSSIVENAYKGSFNGKITSFKQYFDNKKQSSATVSQIEKKDVSQKSTTIKHAMEPKQQAQNKRSRSNSQGSISLQEINGQGDSMKCKEHITSSNFLNIGGQKSKQQQYTQQQGLFGQSMFDNKTHQSYFGEDEYSMMKSMGGGFGQNSINNQLWPNTHSNFFNGGFNKSQHNLNLSPYQVNNNYDNSNMFPFASQMNHLKVLNIAGGQVEDSRNNPYQVRTPFVDDTSQPLLKINAPEHQFTPQKLNFKAEGDKDIGENDDECGVDKSLQNQVQNEGEEQQQEALTSAKIPHPDKIFSLAASNKKQQIKQQKTGVKSISASSSKQTDSDQKAAPSKKNEQKNKSSNSLPPPPPQQYSYPHHPQYYPMMYNHHQYPPHAYAAVSHPPAYQQTFINNNMMFFNQQISNNSNKKKQKKMSETEKLKAKKDSDKEKEGKLRDQSNYRNNYYNYILQQHSSASQQTPAPNMMATANPYFFNLLKTEERQQLLQKQKKQEEE